MLFCADFFLGCSAWACSSCRTDSFFSGEDGADCSGAAIAFAEAVSKNENFKAFIKSVKELGKALGEKFVNALGVVANKIAGLNSSAVKGGASTIDKLAAAFGARSY